MPMSVSNRSLKMLEEICLGEDGLAGAEYPVWIESRVITGYYPALEMKRLISEREDINYIGKVTRNCDRGEIPGFSFVREGAESLNEYIRNVENRRKAAAEAAASAATA